MSISRQNATTAEAQSRFVEKLREIARGPVGRIGFGTTQPKQPPAMLLVVRLPRNDATLAEAATRAGADAVVASILGPAPGDVTFGPLAAERPAIEAILKAASQAIVGVSIGPSDGLSATDLSTMAGLGVDFVIVNPKRAPVELLQIERLGRVVRLDPQYTSAPLRGLNEIGVHAFEATSERPEGSIEEMSLHDLAAYRQLVDSARRPVLIAVASAPGDAGMKSLRELGVEGIVYALPEQSDAASVQSEVGRLRSIIDGLGGPIGRGHALGEPSVVLPQVRVSHGETEEEDEF